MFTVEIISQIYEILLKITYLPSFTNNCNHLAESSIKNQKLSCFQQ